MAQFPFMPLYADAFLADTGHLNATETGAYLMLLMVAWRTPDCKLPDDDQKLSRWARVDPRTWRRIKPKIMEFWTLADGFWAQKRLALEADKARKMAECKRSNGRLGGRPKSLKTNDEANLEVSVSLSEKKLSTATYKKEAPPLSSIVSNKLDTHTKSEFGGRFDEFWIAYPHKVGKDAAERAFEKVRKSGRVQFSGLMAGLEAYKASKAHDRAWCNPATWLNQGRWQDQPAKMNGTGRPQPRYLVV